MALGGRSLLDFALWEPAKLLAMVEEGADLSFKDEEGQTAYQRAVHLVHTWVPENPEKREQYAHLFRESLAILEAASH
jgi:hypothetical protein